MHRFLRQALENVRGESQRAIVVVADIRGFSQFSRVNDSVDVATYISKAYLKLIDSFSTVTSDFFFKPTGDGLLMVFPFDEWTLQTTLEEVVTKCVACHETFGALLADEPVINYDVPRLIGFGISRGSACALTAVQSDKRYILDYSGYKLNMASRLQDLARPSGVVVEGSSDVRMLSKELRNRFRPVNVYVRSVAEITPIEVQVLDSVVVPPHYLKPIAARWENYEKSFSLDELSTFAAQVRIRLPSGTIVAESLTVRLLRPSNPDKGEAAGVTRWQSLESPRDFDLVYDAGNPMLLVKPKLILENFKQFIAGLPEGKSVTLQAKLQLLG